MTIVRTAVELVPLVLLACGACDPGPPPRCADVVAHAKQYVPIDNPSTSVVSDSEKLVPFDHTYSGSDVAFLVNECASWPESYRRCMAQIASDVDFIKCNQGDPSKIAWSAWAALPHVNAWAKQLADLAYDAYSHAQDAATAARTTADDVERQLAAATGSARADLTAKLAAAKASADQAEALASSCKANPLSQPACIALIKKKP
jgi:hypothetical protein